MKIRFAQPEDAKKLLDIYGQYIDTPVTFEYTLPSEQEFAGRIVQIMREYPYLVCEEADQIVGYAYGHRAMERAAYQWNAELSIYLHQAYTSKGLGKKLYMRLMEILKLQGIRNVYGCVMVPNEKSEGLHLAMGFRRLGVYHNTGYKCGKWHDVVWFEKNIQDYGRPKPICPISKIPEEKLKNILSC